MSEYPRLLRRSMVNRQVAGVCSGLAEYLDLDPTLVRVVYVVASVCTAFAGLLVYLLLWMIIPEREYY